MVVVFHFPGQELGPPRKMVSVSDPWNPAVQIFPLVVYDPAGVELEER